MRRLCLARLFGCGRNGRHLPIPSYLGLRFSSLVKQARSCLPCLAVPGCCRRGEHLPIPSQFSPELKDLVKQMLAKGPKNRPSADAILKTPFLKARGNPALCAQEAGTAAACRAASFKRLPLRMQQCVLCSWQPGLALCTVCTAGNACRTAWYARRRAL